MKISAQAGKLSRIKVSQIVEIHDKICKKSGSVSRQFESRKHEENAKFEYSSHTLAEMLEKTRAKCNHATVRVASIENTRENTCKK